jgi:putative transposase
MKRALICGVSGQDGAYLAQYGHPIGIDVGVSKFLATSDNLIVKPPKFFKTLQGKLKLLQSRLSRKDRRSNNYQKQQVKVARLHHKIDNYRKNFHYQAAHKVCDTGDMVFVEDLDYRALAKGFLGKEMLDAGFGQFRTILKQTCWKRGKFFAEVNASGTSQECPNCGETVRKDLSVRIHNCPHCQYVCDRDVAAGQVIRNRGIELISTAGTAGMETACAVDLPGARKETSKSRQVAKSRKGATRKPRL